MLIFLHFYNFCIVAILVTNLWYPIADPIISATLWLRNEASQTDSEVEGYNRQVLFMVRSHTLQLAWDALQGLLPLKWNNKVQLAKLNLGTKHLFLATEHPQSMPLAPLHVWGSLLLTFCSATQQVVYALSEGALLKVLLQCRYENTVLSVSRREGVWTGRVACLVCPPCRGTAYICKCVCASVFVAKVNSLVTDSLVTTNSILVLLRSHRYNHMKNLQTITYAHAASIITEFLQH